MAAQPMKMAAAEGLYEDSGDPAAWTVIANIDTENKDTSYPTRTSIYVKLFSLRRIQRKSRWNEHTSSRI